MSIGKNIGINTVDDDKYILGGNVPKAVECPVGSSGSGVGSGRRMGGPNFGVRVVRVDCGSTVPSNY